MRKQKFRTTKSKITRRKITDKVRQLRREEIRSFVRHWYGLVPLVHVMASILPDLGFAATKATIERDYKALRFRPGEIARHA